MRTMLTLVFSIAAAAVVICGVTTTILSTAGCSQQDRTVAEKGAQVGGCPGGVCPPGVPTTQPKNRTGMLFSEPEVECDNPDCPVHGYKAKGMLRVRILPHSSMRCDPLMGHYLFPQ